MMRNNGRMMAGMQISGSVHNTHTARSRRPEGRCRRLSPRRGAPDARCRTPAFRAWNLPLPDQAGPDGAAYIIIRLHGAGTSPLCPVHTKTQTKT
jgi:hypothetical protein